MIKFSVDCHGFVIGRSEDLEFTINPIGPTLIIDGGWISVEELEQILAKMKELQDNKCHSEKTPSLAITDDNGVVLMHCFGCGVSEH